MDGQSEPVEDSGCDVDFNEERQLEDSDVELFALFPTGEKDEELEQQWKKVFGDPNFRIEQ